jgi:general secretion pathway protein L
VLTLVNVVLQTKQADQQTLIVKKQVEQVYQQAFPDQGRLSYARIKKKLRGLLADASVTEQDSGLLVMLNDIIPAVKAMPNIQISTLTFNGKNQEISLAISSDSFQAFELFSAKIPEQYDYKQGALSNNKNRISGVVTVRAK